MSRWQDNASTPQRMNFARAYARGARFAFIKASQSNWMDRDFTYNFQAAQDAGLLTGAYHYLSWDRSARDQAKFFCGLLAQNRGDLPPVLDYESRYKIPSKALALTALSVFLDEVERTFNTIPIIYTSRGFWREYGSTVNRWARYPLWLAHYTTAPAPILPAPWTHYEFWQYSSTGPGIEYGAESKGIDLNWYAGSEEQLHAKYGKQPPAPPQPEPVTREEFDALERRVSRLEAK